MDIANSFFKVKCKIVKSNGANLADADIATLINYPNGSLFSQVDVSSGGKTKFHHQLTLVPTAQILKQLGMELFFKDTIGHLDDWWNQTHPENCSKYWFNHKV